MKNDFWVQPSKGFTEKTRGRTEEEILAKEKNIGFRFPALYREHMKLQNGGYIRKRAFIGEDGPAELLYNGAVIDAMDGTGYNTMQDALMEYLNMEEVLEQLNLPFADLTRLPILSHMYGHSMLCFDYGYKQKEPFAEPQICLFEMEGTLEERLRVGSYEKLVENMVYYGYESTSYFYGIKSGETLAELAEKLNAQSGTALQKDTSDRYGWFNFNEWYHGTEETAKGLNLGVVLSPNQFRSGTYLFQDRPEYLHILEIIPKIGGDEYLENSNFQLTLIEKCLGPALKAIEAELILLPFNKAEPSVLEKMEAALGA
jgi:hypothetical protein